MIARPTRSSASEAADTHELSAVVNALNAHRMGAVERRVHAFLGVLLAIAVALVGAFALIHFSTPCEGASLCLAAVVPTRRGWVQRLVDSLAQWRLRYYIRSAEQDLAYQHQQLEIAQWECEALPRQMAVTRGYIDQLEAELRGFGPRGV